MSCKRRKTDACVIQGWKWDKKLISRWDSERELFNDDIVHVLQNTIDSHMNSTMSMDCQRTKWHRKMANNFNRLSKADGRYWQTDDRQTGDVANVNLSSRSLKTKYMCGTLSFSLSPSLFFFPFPPSLFPTSFSSFPMGASLIPRFLPPIQLGESGRALWAIQWVRAEPDR